MARTKKPKGIDDEAIVIALAERKGLVGARRKEYFLALGEFADSFAQTETWVHLLFPYFSKIKRATAMAIKGSMRLGDLMSLVKRLMPVVRWSPDDVALVTRLFDQLNAISELRDSVLHRGASLTLEGKLSSSNVATMKSFENLEFVDFTVDDIKKAVEDLALIRRLLSLVVFRKRVLKRFPPELIEESLKQPWLYKSVQREPARQRFLKARQARGRQQKSSGE